VQEFCIPWNPAPPLESSAPPAYARRFPPSTGGWAASRCRRIIRASARRSPLPRSARFLRGGFQLLSGRVFHPLGEALDGRGRAEAVLILLVDVPRAWLRKNRKGLWYSTRDVPPDRIRRVLSFVELAGASAA
jgi:hypothetical protein